MNVILLLAAVICCVIAALLGFGAFSGSHTLGWLALGAAFGWASFLVPTYPLPWNRP